MLYQVFQKHSMEGGDAHAAPVAAAKPPMPSATITECVYSSDEDVPDSEAADVCSDVSQELLQSPDAPRARAPAATAGMSAHPSVVSKVEVAAFMLMLYGVQTFVGLWVMVVLTDVAGVELFEYPSRSTVVVLTLNALLDAAFNGFLLVGILITSPLFMAVGGMLVRSPCMSVALAPPNLSSSLADHDIRSDRHSPHSLWR
jgi:hypothetical protein